MLSIYVQCEEIMHFCSVGDVGIGYRYVRSRKGVDERKMSGAVSSNGG